jgi:hypothetical protein
METEVTPSSVLLVGDSNTIGYPSSYARYLKAAPLTFCARSGAAGRDMRAAALRRLPPGHRYSCCDPDRHQRPRESDGGLTPEHRGGRNRAARRVARRRDTHNSGSARLRRPRGGSTHEGNTPSNLRRRALAARPPFGRTPHTSATLVPACWRPGSPEACAFCIRKSREEARGRNGAPRRSRL